MYKIENYLIKKCEKLITSIMSKFSKFRDWLSKIIRENMECRFMHDMMELRDILNQSIRKLEKIRNELQEDSYE